MVKTRGVYTPRQWWDYKLFWELSVKIIVLGAGAMGSLFGGRLALAGFDVGLIDVNVQHIEAVRREGLTLEGDDGLSSVFAPIGPADAFHDPADLLIVFTKGPHSEAALRSAAHLIGSSTLILTLQNGLGNGDRIAALAPRDRVMIGMTNWPADVRAPGRVASHGQGQVRLWTLNGAGGNGLDAVCAALSKAGLNCTLDPDVLAAIWEKAAFNAAMNSVAAITERTVGEMADDSDTRALILTVAEEAAGVATARGLAVSRSRIVASIEHAFADHRSHKPSMLQDILAGRATEIDSINGAIVAEAALAGVSAPVIETLARLVRAKEHKGLL